MTKLILVPGLGANRLLFEPQRREFEGVMFVPDWPPPIFTQVEGKSSVPETLRDYARRWADRWLQTALSKPEDRARFWVGGMSFGGQVALEAALRLVEEGVTPRGVIILSGNRTSASLPKRFALAQALGGLVPASMLPALLLRSARVFARREGLSELDERLLSRIAEAVDVAHLRWGARAARRWKFGAEDLQRLKEAGVAVHQIHGEQDWVIPLHAGDPDRVIEGGKHLINFTHAGEVNAFIRACLHSAD